MIDHLLQSYFLMGRAGGALLAQDYNQTLVLASFVVAAFAAYTTLGLVYHMRVAFSEQRTSSYRNWWAAASLSLGGGIFAMHFVGMMAFSISVDVRYDLGVTVFSLLAAVAGSAVAIGALRHQHLSQRNLIRAALVMGLSVASMHYIGMASLIAPALLRYLPGLWIFAVVIAIVVSMVAMILLRWMSSAVEGGDITKKLLVATLMGAAVAAMHYTGMAAAQFYSGGTCGVSTGLFEIEMGQFQLGVTVSVIALIVIGLGLVTSIFNDRYHTLLREKNQDLEKAVERRTVEIQQYTEQLYQQNSELKLVKMALDQHAIVSYTDPEGTILDLNERFCEISGYSREELIGKNHRIVKSGVHPPEFYKNIWDTITRGGIWRGEVTNLKKGGKERYWVNATIIPELNDKQEIVRYISIRSDISDRVRAEQARKRIEEVEQLNRAKDDFLASMSHELRTPLTSIIGNGEVLQGTDLDDKQRAIVRTIESSGRRQLALVNDILDLSKIESGKFVINQVPFNLQQLVLEVSELFSSQAGHSGAVQFKVLQKVQFDHMLIGDEQRIGQVLINLLSNAFKFAERGEVELQVWSVGERLLMQVEDQGIGMSQAVLDRLFQPFEQADSSISRRFGGTGLGLHISRALAHLMGGEITVESEEGGGSKFIFSIPLQESAEPLQQAVGEAEDEEAPCFRGRVLIAEDTLDIQQLQRTLLEEVGVEVECANNGLEAVEQAKQEDYDLILMDMQMPLMDGIQATMRLREEGYQTPIYAVTANVMQQHRDQMSAAGSNGFVSKPFVRGDLYRVLRKHLEVRPVGEGGCLGGVDVLHEEIEELGDLLGSAQ